METPRQCGGPSLFLWSVVVRARRLRGFDSIHGLFLHLVASSARCRVREWPVCAKRGQAACKPGSVRGLAAPGRPFLWDARLRAPRATHPGGERGNAPAAWCRQAIAGPRGPSAVRPYSVLLPVGFAVPRPLPARAVRSCRTVSPLPAVRPEGIRAERRRSVLCGTVPGVAPAGRYPAPCSRGARTFLTPPPFGACLPCGRVRSAAVQPPDPGLSCARNVGEVKQTFPTPRARDPRRGRARGPRASASRHRPGHRSGAAPSAAGRRRR